MPGSHSAALGKEPWLEGRGEDGESGLSHLSSPLILGPTRAEPVLDITKNSLKAVLNYAILNNLLWTDPPAGNCWKLPLPHALSMPGLPRNACRQGAGGVELVILALCHPGIPLCCGNTQVLLKWC